MRNFSPDGISLPDFVEKRFGLFALSHKPKVSNNHGLNLFIYGLERIQRKSGEKGGTFTGPGVSQNLGPGHKGDEQKKEGQALQLPGQFF